MNANDVLAMLTGGQGQGVATRPQAAQVKGDAFAALLQGAQTQGVPQRGFLQAMRAETTAPAQDNTASSDAMTGELQANLQAAASPARDGASAIEQSEIRGAPFWAESHPAVADSTPAIPEALASALAEQSGPSRAAFGGISEIGGAFGTAETEADQGSLIQTLMNPSNKVQALNTFKASGHGGPQAASQALYAHLGNPTPGQIKTYISQLENSGQPLSVVEGTEMMRAIRAENAAARQAWRDGTGAKPDIVPMNKIFDGQSFASRGLDNQRTLKLLGQMLNKAQQGRPVVDGAPEIAIAKAAPDASASRTILNPDAVAKTASAPDSVATAKITSVETSAATVRTAAAVATAETGTFLRQGRDADASPRAILENINVKTASASPTAFKPAGADASANAPAAPSAAKAAPVSYTQGQPAAPAAPAVILQIDDAALGKTAPDLDAEIQINTRHAEIARADRAMPGVQASRAGGTPVLDSAAAMRLAKVIAGKASDGQRSFEIRMDPPELGKIDVRLEIGADRKVHALLLADKPETLADLERSARALERALAEAGLDVKRDSLSFGLRQDGQGRGFDRQDNAGGAIEMADSGSSETERGLRSDAPREIEAFGFRTAARMPLSVSV